jgi:hypothetical protein
MKAVRVSDDFGYAIRNFLDRFRHSPSLALLDDAPELLAELLDDGGLADAYVAAAAAWLCQVNGLQAPPWVNMQSRIMRKPWFAAKTPNLKAILIQESPAAFRVRNLFVSANALSRA